MRGASPTEQREQPSFGKSRNKRGDTNVEVRYITSIYIITLLLLSELHKSGDTVATNFAPKNTVYSYFLKEYIFT
jgi:hypothetical protein